MLMRIEQNQILNSQKLDVILNKKRKRSSCTPEDQFSEFENQLNTLSGGERAYKLRRICDTHPGLVQEMVQVFLSTSFIPPTTVPPVTQISCAQTQVLLTAKSEQSPSASDPELSLESSTNEDWFLLDGFA
eukprot:TRINITY_DN178_c0_g1_i3.p1 TRINITY_DN178_c0_g1~~TRINITY_DN178_c0_g1_i3.p1  ORF type:complete len:131 (+),score=23.50 TRINITY_DN178_c0_g1_i3:709-1101(+)